jgi:tetrahydrodipicolinate N-succinyltransferase
MGVNATVANNVTIGDDNWVGLGVVIKRDTPSNQLYKGLRYDAAEQSAMDFFKVADS